ncbi:anthranilate phosphoribosyltransferase [Paenibacillus physcomitrellae]|uniref:Anthranilate phosphoribosyltransferase n=1 Tax=Paenibacillus physcomitrellae TaxID=1619311 RepID=A0ABQ1FNN4_9BACL|nr:anthranilate phosphoribosyltransferase [Paenibacillus physcomitrellae]GGA23118.1 anthranilate phosphoribosyltransferase [Paenibacillus physcomitrellae]
MSEFGKMQAGLAKVVGGSDLSRDEARELMNLIMEGEATPAQIGGLLAALRFKGETVQEITGFAEAMRSKAAGVGAHTAQLLDTCGTGGSGIQKFNISTAAAVIASSASVRIAKHGNRSASSKAGSADVLEALGVNIHLNGEQAKRCLDEIGLCFLFAQVYHPSMKHAAGPRKELGMRTVFNLLGPLTNPAGADRQLLGIYDPRMTETIAKVLRELGSVRALVVSSGEGLDEISLSSPTRVSELKDGEVRTFEITAADLGLTGCSLEEVYGGDAVRNAQLIREILNGRKGPARDIVLANAGACIYLAGHADGMAEGVAIAAEAIDSGKAAGKLQQLIETTGALSYVS